MGYMRVVHKIDSTHGEPGGHMRRAVCGRWGLGQGEGFWAYADWVVADQPKMSKRDDDVTCKACLRKMEAR